MKMIKKLTVLLMAALIAVAAVSCGKSEDTSSKQESSVESSVESSAENSKEPSKTPSENSKVPEKKEDFSKTAGIWRLDGDDSAFLEMDGKGKFTSYYESGSIETTGTLIVGEEDGKTVYRMKEENGEMFNTFYFASDSEIRTLDGFYTYLKGDVGPTASGDLAMTEGLWRLDGEMGTASIEMNGYGDFTTYYGSGSLETMGTLRMVEQDGKTVFEMVSNEGSVINSFYFVSSEEIRTTDETFSYFREEIVNVKGDFDMEGIWRRGNLMDEPYIELDEMGNFSTYHGSGALGATGALILDPDGYYNLVADDGRILNSLYFESDTELRVENRSDMSYDEGFQLPNDVYVREEISDPNAPMLVTVAGFTGTQLLENNPNYYGGQYTSLLTADGKSTIFNIRVSNRMESYETPEDYALRMVRMQEVAPETLRDFTMEHSEKYTRQFTYPTSLMRWYADSDMGTLQGDGIFFMTDSDTYLYYIVTDVDNAAVMYDTWLDAFDRLELVDPEY